MQEKWFFFLGRTNYVTQKAIENFSEQFSYIFILERLFRQKACAFDIMVSRALSHINKGKAQEKRLVLFLCFVISEKS